METVNSFIYSHEQCFISKVGMYMIDNKVNRVIGVRDVKKNRFLMKIHCSGSFLKSDMGLPNRNTCNRYELWLQLNITS